MDNTSPVKSDFVHITEYEKLQKQIDKLNKVVEAAKDFEKTLCIDVHIPPVPVTGKLAALVKALAELNNKG